MTWLTVGTLLTRWFRSQPRATVPPDQIALLDNVQFKTACEKREAIEALEIAAGIMAKFPHELPIEDLSEERVRECRETLMRHLPMYVP